MLPEKKHEMLKLAGFDALQLFAMIATAALLFWLSNILPELTGEKVLAPVLSVLASLILICLAGHFLVRILFPRMNIADFQKKALESGTGAGLVIFGVCVVLSTVILVGCLMLKG